MMDPPYLLEALVRLSWELVEQLNAEWQLQQEKARLAWMWTGRLGELLEC